MAAASAFWCFTSALLCTARFMSRRNADYRSLPACRHTTNTTGVAAVPPMPCARAGASALNPRNAADTGIRDIRLPHSFPAESPEPHEGTHAKLNLR
jgi:hypothetical protein